MTGEDPVDWNIASRPEVIELMELMEGAPCRLVLLAKRAATSRRRRRFFGWFCGCVRS